MRIQPLFLFYMSVLFALPAHAINVGSEANNTPGLDAFGAPVGVYGAVDLGNNEQSGDTLGDLVGSGGNTATVCFPDILAPEAASFTMTASGCSGAGTQTASISASNASQVCDDLSALNQGCSWRNEACTHNGSPGGMFDIVGPFLCTLDHWEFFTGTVTAAPSTVDITEVTEAEASIVDYFTLTVGGTQVEANAASFSAVTNSIQLESVLEGLSTLFDVTLSGTTLTFTTTATGPIALTDLHLEFSTPASIATVEVTDISDAVANVVNRFTLNINRSEVSTSGLDYNGVSNGTELAAVLNTVSGIEVIYNGGNNKIVIAASTAGAITFSNVLLASVPELGGAAQARWISTKTAPPWSSMMPSGAGLQAAKATS